MTAPLEEKVIKTLMKELGEDFSLVLSAYLDKMAGRLLAITTAMEKRDRERLSQAAHALKGSSRQFGASRLAELCHTLENRCKNGPLEDDLQSILTTLQEEAAMVQLSLEKMGITTRGD